VLQLIISKCLPILLYGLEARSLVKSQLSLEFVINRLFMKLFRTNNMNIVKKCQTFFGCVMPGLLRKRRVDKLETKMRTSDNIFVTMALSMY